MALIDRTYFVGELNIPNWDQAPVGELVDYFIEKYEDQFLRRALGLDLYNALRAGLLVNPVQQRFTDLIDGKDYTYGSFNYEWLGLVTQPPSVLNALDALNTIAVLVGGSGQFDPVSGSVTAPLPTALVGKTFIIEQRGFGQLLNSEYSVAADVTSPSGYTVTLLNSVFAVGNTYFYKSAQLAVNTTTGSVKRSPIANYVYYFFMRDNFTQSTTMGEASTNKENSLGANPGGKMVAAWNEMSRQMDNLRRFMLASLSVYPEWKLYRVGYFVNHFSRINEFNI